MKVEQNSQFIAPTLISDELYLRPGKVTDFLAIKEYRQNPENCRYIRPPETDEQVIEIVEQLSQPWSFAEGRWNGWVICVTGDDTAIGEMVFNIESWDHQRAEIGYRINETASGKGVCTSAAKLLVDYLFSEVGVFKVVAKCDPRNTASSRVMEKLGMVKEAEFKQHYLMAAEWTDQHDYGILSSQWRS